MWSHICSNGTGLLGQWRRTGGDERDMGRGSDLFQASGLTKFPYIYVCTKYVPTCIVVVCCTYMLRPLQGGMATLWNLPAMVRDAMQLSVYREF